MLEIALLDPSDVHVGDLYWDTGDLPVEGIVPERIFHFKKDEAPPDPQFTSHRLPFVIPYIVSRVYKDGFDVQHANGDKYAERKFDEPLYGMILTQNREPQRLYVDRRVIDIVNKISPK